MHLSDFMAAEKLSDEDVAAAVGRDRATVSRWRRRKVRPEWDAIESIKAFTGGAVTADDWVGPLVPEGEPVEARA